MDFRTIVILIILLFLSWWILNIYGIVGGNKAAKKAATDKRALQALQKKRRRISWVLKQFELFATRVGGGISETTRVKYDLIITRREMTVKTLNRLWKPIELVGLFRLLAVIGVTATAIGVAQLSFNILWLFAALLFIPRIFVATAERRMIDEDYELEQDFPDLYLLLNPKLQMGANARIAPVLTEYIASMDRTYTEREHIAIRRFVRLLRNYIEMYSDEVLALEKLRMLYSSAMVVNFCNIAIQAMNGVDNREKLIAFEQELTRQKMDAMRVRAQQLVRRGQRATMVIYIILFEFVILSWVSRLGGNLDVMFNLF